MRSDLRHCASAKLGARMLTGHISAAHTKMIATRDALERCSETNPPDPRKVTSTSRN
jgi:hypothetical protein